MFIVMNLFMAILLSNFDELSEPDEDEAEGPGADVGIESLVKVTPSFDDEDPVMQMLRRNKKTKVNNRF